MVEMEGVINKIIDEEELPKKKISFRGKTVEGVALTDIVGGHGIKVVAKDGYSAHFKEEEIKNLILSRNCIFSPYEGLSIKNVAKIIVEKERYPSAVIKPDLATLQDATHAISGGAKEYPLKVLLPPSFSYLIAYSPDGYHASFSFEEAQTVLIDRDKNLITPQMRKARRLKNVERIEVYE